MLRRHQTGQPLPLLVVVHGHGGGAVPPVLQAWLEELACQRSAPVWIQPLTAEPLELPPQQSLLLVPLLLTPGSHVRHDIPAIRARLRAAGHRLLVLPFLGAWPAWIQHLAEIARAADCRSVLHHPLRPGLADRYLAQLSSRLELPLVSAAQADAALDHALPLALAPNRMTAQLAHGREPLPALLERPQTRQFLFDLLLDLP